MNSKRFAHDHTPSNGHAAVLDRPTPSANGHPSPSANGAVGGGSPDLAPTVRETNGRFAKGNPGGPGNPFARQVAALRKALVSSITPEDIAAITAKMKQLALEGDKAAAKLIYTYAVGKPAPPPDPDRLDEDEWDRFKAQAPMLQEMPPLLVTPSPDLALTAVRAARPVITHNHGGILCDLLRLPPKEAQNVFDRLEEPSLEKLAAELSKKSGKRPSANRPNGAGSLTVSRSQRPASAKQ